MNGHRKILRGIFLLGFIACVLYVTVLTRTDSLTRNVILSPFESWRTWLTGDWTIGIEILENIGLFVPLGYLLALFFSADGDAKRTKPVLTILTGFLLSLGVEALQYLLGRGLFEMDDLFDNTLGTVLGLLLYRLAASVLLKRESGAGRVMLGGVLPVLMLLAGLLGCRQMSRPAGMTNPRQTDDFWFSVEQADGDSFSGRCFLYNDAQTDYQILLTHGHEVLKAEVTRDGDSYTATAARSPGVQYELQVRFSGYVRLSAGVYLTDEEVQYVEGETPPIPTPASSDEQPLPADAVLKAFSAEYDCYVFQSGGELLYLIGDDIAEDTEIIYHIHTNEPELLPEHRIVHGFDNLGFYPKNADRTLGSYRLFIRPIPVDYPITSIIVGLYPGGEVVWNSSFRP